MKILFFARLFYPHIGGVEKHVFEISQLLLKKGYEVSVITEKFDDSPEKEVYKGITIYRVAVGGEDWFKKFRVWQGVWKLSGVIRSADVVHCHDIFFWYLPFRLLFPKKHIYITFHGHEAYPISQKSIAVRKIAEKLSWGSLLVSDSLKKWYKANPTFVIYGAVAVDKTKKPVAILAKKKITISLVGRLDADRGVETYIAVLKELKKRKIDYTFTAYGDGPFRKELAKYGNTPGFVSDIEAKVKNTDIMFASSYLSIMEGLKSKKLLVATYENPLKRDCLLETPFTKYIIVSDDAKKIADRIIYLKEHKKEKDALVTDAYKWVSQQTWEKMTNVYLKLWHVAGK